MEITDQDIDIAGTEADDSVRQRHEPPQDHDSAGRAGAKSEPDAVAHPRGDPDLPGQAQDLK